MNNLMKKLAFVGAAAVLFGACGDDSRPGEPTPDTTNGTDTTPMPDTTPSEDTTPTPDTTPIPDTTTETWPCTPEERNTFEGCISACGDNDQPCVTGCTNALSATCNQAFQNLMGCIQANCANVSQAALNECAAQNCEAQLEDFYGPFPEPGDCNPITSAECDAGQTCTYVGNDGAVGCVPAGTIDDGEPCGQGIGNCKRGACLGDGSNNVCTPFCNQAVNTCPDGGICNVALEGSDYTHCGPAPSGCDLFAQDCGPNEACYVVTAAGDTTCYQAGPGAEGASCANVNSCQAGLLCAGNPGFCRAICDAGAEEDECGAGNACTGIGAGEAAVCIPEQ